MKSEIKIDFIDRGTGVGLEPVIRVEIRKSDDPRDTLISTLFQSLGGSYLQLHYSNHKQVMYGEHADMEKTVLLFKPEENMEELMSIVRMAFCEWALSKGWSATSVIGKEYYYSNANGDTATDKWLLKEFLAEKAVHST